MLKEIAEKAKTNVGDFLKLGEMVPIAVRRAQKASKEGRYQVYIPFNDYKIPCPSQRDLIISELIALGFNAYCMGGILVVTWKDAECGLAKEIKEMYENSLTSELANILSEPITQLSSRGNTGSTFYLDDPDFSSLVQKYSRDSILNVLKEYFTVSEKSEQEIYISWI